MPTYIRVKDLPNSASSLNADDFIMLSGSIAGARKIQKSDFLSTVADEFNASPSTYKLATLDASNKVDSSQWPASAFSYQGTWQHQATHQLLPMDQAPQDTPITHLILVP